MCAAEHAPRDPFRLLERNYGLAEIVEHGSSVLVKRLRKFFSLAAEVRSYVGVALFGLAGLLSVFGPVHGTSRQAFYALIVLKAPICWALKRLFPALMTGNTDV